MSKESFYPDIIKNLPQADIPIEGITSYLLQGENQQVVFMSFDKDVSVPEHSHAAQWGVVLDGESELTIGGKLHVLKKGDTYYIPKDVPHSGKLKAGFKDVTVFDQKDRYSAIDDGI
jgi:quercetin dioxygenase-like cupin family protein